MCFRRQQHAPISCVAFANKNVDNLKFRLVHTAIKMVQNISLVSVVPLRRLQQFKDAILCQSGWSGELIDLN